MGAGERLSDDQSMVSLRIKPTSFESFWGLLFQTYTSEMVSSNHGPQRRDAIRITFSNRDQLRMMAVTLGNRAFDSGVGRPTRNPGRVVGASTKLRGKVCAGSRRSFKIASSVLVEAIPESFYLVGDGVYADSDLMTNFIRVFGLDDYKSQESIYNKSIHKATSVHSGLERA